MGKLMILIATFAAFMALESVNVYGLPEGASAGASEPACLLQSTFSSSDLTLDEVEISDVPDATASSIPKSVKSAILFESNVLEEHTSNELRTRSRARSQSCKAHLAYMERKVHGLERAHNVSNENMDQLINGFISKQSGSQDACSSQLMEAKHQMNQLHKYVTDLVVEVNTTERAILALYKDEGDKIAEIEALDKWKEDELQKCEEKKKEYIAMHGQLSNEMEEMKQIASPGVAMNVTTGAVISAETAVGLVQLPFNTSSPPTKDRDQLQSLITGTQSAAKEFVNCMSHKMDNPDVSQLQRSVVVGSFEVRDVTEQVREFKLSKWQKSCQESYGWRPASVRQVAKWCGCDVKNKDIKGWCECPEKLEPLIGDKPKWTLVGLKDGQAMGRGYQYGVKFAAKGAEKTNLDLCTPKKETFQVGTMAPQTNAPTIIHVDPPEEKPLQVGTMAPQTEAPTIIHVDPPEPIRQPRGVLNDEVGSPVDNEASFGAGSKYDAYTPAPGVKPGELTVDDLRTEEDEAANAAAASIKAGAATPEQCAEEKKTLEETYVKTYVELSRLKDEYNELANSNACFRAVEDTYDRDHEPLQEALNKLIKEITEKTSVLETLRPRLESAQKAESQLRKHIATLSAECAELPATVSNLNKVRDTIQALSKCPGLSRVQFSLPKWTGQWIAVRLKAKEMNDTLQDNALNDACGSESEGARAAEVGEIEEQTVEGIPLTNTAGFPLIGTCPNCEGDESDVLPSGHKRICWKQGKELNHKERSTNCASGEKAVLCVTDHEDIREIPGED